MNKEDKIILTNIYKKYHLRDDHIGYAINNDPDFDTRHNLPVCFVNSDALPDGTYGIIHASLYRIERETPTKIPVYPDAFTLVE